MDIRGLSYARIQQLVGEGLVRDPADLYALTREKLLELEGYADKGADGLIAAIEASKTQPLSRLLNALGIRHVGSIAAQLLAQGEGTHPRGADLARRRHPVPRPGRARGHPGLSAAREIQACNLK